MISVQFVGFTQLICVCVCVCPCSTASNSPRSTPGSSPSLRRRVLGGGKASEGEGGVGGADSPLPSVPSAYPLASRHFSRNAKVRTALKARR